MGFEPGVKNGSRRIVEWARDQHNAIGVIAVARIGG
jgi:hypothetical protein